MSEDKQPEAGHAPTLPAILPILPVVDSVLFPKMVTPLLVMQPDSVQLIDEAMSRDRMIGMVFAKPDPAQEGPQLGHHSLVVRETWNRQEGTEAGENRRAVGCRRINNENRIGLNLRK